MWRVHFLAAIFFYKYKFKFKLYPCLKEKMKKIFLLETDWKFRKKSKKKLSLLVEHFRILNHLLCMSKVKKSSFLCFCFIPVNFAYKLTKFFSVGSEQTKSHGLVKNERKRWAIIEFILNKTFLFRSVLMTFWLIHETLWGTKIV